MAPKALQYEHFIATLEQAGLAAGDSLLIQSDLLRCGPVDGCSGRVDVLNFYLDALRQVLTPAGTLVVLTAFEDYGRYGTPFDRASSPSRSGVFSEYVRQLPGAIRSAHPILSLTAIGAKAEAICSGNHYDGFGYDSPWGRLHRMNAKLVTLGYAVAPDGMTFCHYTEQLYGVPYQYTKMFDYPVLDNGVPVAGTFSMAVRYLDYDVNYDQSKFKRDLVTTGRGRTLPVGRGEMLVTDCYSLVDQALLSFARDRFVMLAHPPSFRRGEIPFDVKDRL